MKEAWREDYIQFDFTCGEGKTVVESRPVVECGGGGGDGEERN